MNREIKFRGLDLETKEWVYGYYSQADGKHYISLDNPAVLMEAANGVCAIESFVEVDPATVSQFTGLRGKNGKEIYEGDILHCSGTAYADTDIPGSPASWPWELTAEVKVSDENDSLAYGFEPFLDAAVDPEREAEVIGNKFQNPELLP
jgi:uncharacterized phage protein (TIGR01671 family)